MFCPAWWSTWPPLGKLVAVTVIPAGTVRMVELIDELPFGVSFLKVADSTTPVAPAVTDPPGGTVSILRLKIFWGD